MAAVAASGFKPIPRVAKIPLSTGWKELMAELSAKRAHIGLSRFARWCSTNGIEPIQVTDVTLTDFINAVRHRTLHRKPNGLHRNVALIWNEAVQRSHLNLQSSGGARPSAALLNGSIGLLLPDRFRKDVDAFLTWCAGVDPFAADARPRALAPQTVKLRRAQIHAAATALVESGINPKTIRSLAISSRPKTLKRILRRRNEMVGRRENIFNHDLARTLVEIARRWVKVRSGDAGQTQAARQQSPDARVGSYEQEQDNAAPIRRSCQCCGGCLTFRDRLWAEVKRDTRPNFRTLVKAQAALGVGILCYMPVRPQNLSALKFDEHIFLHEGPGAISSLELPAHEVKNRIALAFDIPPHLAKMLIEYRNRLAPKVIGRRPDRLFVKADGTAKNQWAVAWLIRTYLRKRAGLQLSGHQFRHVGAKGVLDAEPGNFETVRQLLGHASLQTTV